MNISKLAQLAGVSVSTVSKIMNNKDESISAATRERVLKIAKEYHYQPYAAALSKDSKTWTLGVLLRSSASMNLALTGMLETAQQAGYTLMIRESGGDEASEERNLSVLCSLRIDGLLWEPLSPDSLRHRDMLEEAHIPAFLFNIDQPQAVNIDYATLGYQATQKLVELGHTDIGCLLSEGTRTQAFLAGYQQCLFDNHIPLREEFVFRGITDSLLQKISAHAVSGIVNSHYAAATALFDAITVLHYQLPYDLSLITLRDDSRGVLRYPKISGYTIPHCEFGRYLCSRLIAHVEKAPDPGEVFLHTPVLDSSDSIGIPYNNRSPKIAVVGSINIDNYLNVDKLPRTGKTVNSSISAIYVGGKAINQSVGVSRLGHRVSLIGCVGNDVDSDTVFTTLNQYRIDPVGVRRRAGYKTGQAYIFVQHDGNSMISIMSGANEALSPDDLSQDERLFENTAYCLLQTEIPLPTVTQAARLARRRGITTILKPAACGVLPRELLENVDILVPNHEELQELCPSQRGMDAQTDFLLKQGVGTVIVTLGENGCYVKNAQICQRLPAQDFDPVDSSGACDAFISGLASYLLYGYPLLKAVRIATYAAGFSVTREGVVPSLIDRNSLEAYIRQREPDLLAPQ